jgi:hypothetical protein
MSEHPDSYQEARQSIQNTIEDQVTKLLVGNSHLTVPQLATLLADSISYEKLTKKEHRRLFRPSKQHVSRGAYNRTLIQAQNNVIRSIYTVLLLGYVGLFDSSSLQPFLELSDNLESYAAESDETTTQGKGAVEDLKSKLAETISSLARRHSFKDIL